MHELSIAESILDAVRVEAQKRPGAHVAKVAVRVGVLSGVEPDALSFGFECLVRGTELEPLALVIEPVPRRQRCPACDLTFDVSDDKNKGVGSDVGAPQSSAFDFGPRTSDFGLPLSCPRCRLANTALAGGDELEMAYLEIEEQ
jgi:hydrogenase nickel incorporation protein HypA/HybF